MNLTITKKIKINKEKIEIARRSYGVSEMLEPKNKVSYRNYSNHNTN